MTFFELVFFSATCLVALPAPEQCLHMAAPAPPVASQAAVLPQRTGQAVDVVISAEAALVWDVTSGEVLYDKNARMRRPVASLVKLLSILYVKQRLPGNSVIEISPEVAQAQRSGASIRLPIGQHASAHDLMAASLIASANDAVVALAIAVADSEAAFVAELNEYAQVLGLPDTHLVNATGLSGGEQYSTATDIRHLLTRVAQDPELAPLLRQPGGTLVTVEGTRRSYETTNQLLGTYLPVTAAKTGYTVEAGENLALLTTGSSGQRLGAVILGSTNRFYDMKALVEWTMRNYTWP